ncbi:MAG: hypothetical protein FWC62_08170, partial [Firmicutes bacterium]|nr:hypothetical protein [Bacillota bacterium]
MRRLIRPGRLVALCMLLIGFVALYVTGLFKLQIVEGKVYANISQNSIQTDRTVTAARGNILDRYGRLLVSNRVCNNLVLNTGVLYAGDAATDGTANANILQMVNTVLSCGDTYLDPLPITKEPPFAYIDNMSDTQRVILNAYVKENGLRSDATAVDLMAYFRDRYNIDNKYGAADMRTIAGIRYATNIVYLNTVHPDPYIFAQDVRIETITALMESGLQGIEVQQGYVR